MIYLAVVPVSLLVALLAYVIFGGPKLPPETDAVIDAVLQSDLSHVVSGTTGFASSDGTCIWYERRPPEGNSRGVIILNMGMGGDALFWPPSFLRTLTDAGYDVIRYDYRGTGLSDWMETWDRKHPYTLQEMSEDAMAVLDDAGVERAHAVGVSMGGMIAQEMAIAHPDRVASLTLMSTSGNAADPELPGLTSTFLVSSLLQGIPLLKYRLLGGERNLVKERIAKTITVAGIEGLDIRELAEVVLYDLRQRRGINLRGVLQHQTAVGVTRSRYDELGTLDVPTLLIHGTDDQFLPAAHALKLEVLIPNADSMWLEGVGHVFPYPEMEDVDQRILAHLSSAA